MNHKNNIEYFFLMGTCVLILLFYFFPYLYFQEESYITVHDNLDSVPVLDKTVAQSGKLFSFNNDVLIENIMNGIPRNCLPPAFNLGLLLFYFFNTFTSLIINFVLIHVLAFFGMFILLKDFVFKNKEEALFLFGISVCFSLIPFWGIETGIAVAGLPVVAWCFVHFFKGSYKFYHYVILIIFVFYSSLIFTGIFVLITLSIIYLYFLFFHKKYNLPFLVGIVIMSCGYIIAELNLVIQFLSGDYISHRVEFKSVGDSFFQSLKNTIDIFLKGSSHASASTPIADAPTLNSPFITLVSIFGLLASLKSFKRKDINKVKYLQLIIIIFSTITGISIFYGIWSYNGFLSLIENVNILKIIVWSRFQWLTPFLWYLLFSLSIKVFIDIYPTKTFIRSTALMLICLQIIFMLIMNNELRINYVRIYSKIYKTENLLGKNIKNYLSEPNFRQFYDEKLFKEIKEYIGRPQNEYRVLSLGIYPDIAIYNGFYSLDSYQHNYPLIYKHKFRKIICSELDKSDKQKDYFDDWGNRCYAFSSELGGTASQLIGKDSAKVIKKLDFDVGAIKELGGKYILSAAQIDPSNNPSFVLKKTFSHNDSFWKIYLYEVI
jgi:hypothetical protein